LLYSSPMNTHAMIPSPAQRALLLAIAMLAPAQAADMPVAAIARAAEQAAVELVGGSRDATVATAASIDPRLRLAPCTVPLATRIDPPRGTAARLLVRVSCDAPVRWSVFVPVRIESTTEVLVLRRQKARGDHLVDDDVRTEIRRISGVSENYVKSAAELEGYRLRRPLPAGSLLEREALEPALSVLRGSAVTLVADSGAYRIESAGRALADAAPGQRVRVQNLTSLKIVEGVADNRGVVRIGP
jgi:flagella basal body P-ring formation protein FlgA